MKIKNALTLSSLVFVIFLLAIGLLMVYSFRQINREVKESYKATQLIKDMFELNIVTYEYLIHREKRMQQQWKLKYNSSGELLRSMIKEDIHSEYPTIMVSLIKDYEELGNLFSRILVNFNKSKRLIAENKPQEEIDITLAIEERLNAQALMRSQNITTKVFKFSDIVKQRIIQTQQRAILVALFSIIGFAVFASCVSFFAIRAITRPINALIKGAERIGKGHLEYHVNIKTKNEIGTLAASFTSMAGRLKEANEELEQRVIQRTAELETANKELESFSYSVSHDLRAPLRAISGFSEMLVEDYGDKLDSDGRHQLEVIRSSVRDMGQLIDDLLAFSRLGRKEMSVSVIDMSALVQEVFKKLQLAPEASKARLKAEELAPACGDLAMIREVFFNLLSNAFKFSKPQKTPVIEVGSRIEGEEQIYSVRDNGVGFDMKYADKLFRVFQRLHRTEEFEGTGIGLALVQRIIYRHGGRVWAEGKVNQGATFYFSLPRDEE